VPLPDEYACVRSAWLSSPIMRVCDLSLPVRTGGSSTGRTPFKGSTCWTSRCSLVGCCLPLVTAFSWFFTPVLSLCGRCVHIAVRAPPVSCAGPRSPPSGSSPAVRPGDHMGYYIVTPLRLHSGYGVATKAYKCALVVHTLCVARGAGNT
jgi:hypothetical protein